jgi:hypothetical protein
VGQADAGVVHREQIGVRGTLIQTPKMAVDHSHGEADNTEVH